MKYVLWLLFFAFTIVAGNGGCSATDHSEVLDNSQSRHHSEKLKKVFNELTGILDYPDVDPNIIIVGIKYLSEIKTDDTVEPLISRFLTHTNADVRRAAIKGLVKLGKSVDIEAKMEVALSDRNSGVRDIALIFTNLYQIGSNEWRMKSAIRLLNDPVPALRVSALKLLDTVSYDDNSIEDTVAKLLDDENAEVQIAAMETIAVLNLSNPEICERLKDFLSGNDSLIVAAARFALLSSCNNSSGLSWLTEMLSNQFALKHPNYDNLGFLHFYIFEYLSYFDYCSEISDFLQTNFDDPTFGSEAFRTAQKFGSIAIDLSDAIRCNISSDLTDGKFADVQTAFEALITIDPASQETIELVRDLTSIDNLRVALRANYHLFASGIEPQKSINFIKDYLVNSDKIKLNVEEVISAAGLYGSDGLPFLPQLYELLDSKDKYIRYAALVAIDEIENETDSE